MKITIQLVIEADDTTPTVVENVVSVTRTNLSPDTLGLHLAEAHDLLQHVQASMVSEQVSGYLIQQRLCADCGKRRARKGQHTLKYRTLFGKLTLPSPQYYVCSCHQEHQRRSESPLARLLPERSAPELVYLEAKWASLMSYGLTATMLSEILPINHRLESMQVRRDLHRAAERAEDELGEEQGNFIDGCSQEWGALPRPDPGLAVGLDGDYVRGRNGQSRSEGHFEVIVGKSLAETGSKCLAFVNRYDTKRKRRLFTMLESQGMQMNQSVTLFSDGGETVRELQGYLNPQAEYILDWFHVTMRLTVMRNMAKSVVSKEQPDLAQQTDAQLERIKWFVWNGNVWRAQQTIDELAADLDMIEEDPSSHKFLKALGEFDHYIANNAGFIPNYGDRYRHGEKIATGFVESTVNQVISKRLVKKQSMRWTDRGAHLLLQVRTKVLNNELRSTFERWHSGMKKVA